MDKGFRQLFCSTVFMLLFTSFLVAQSQDSPTLFEHTDDSRVWISGQINVIHQQHPGFFAKYGGENSLQSEREKATSRVLTLYTGVEITKSTEVLFDIESAGGRGLSDALGLAGFTNLDVVRNPKLGPKPYLARLLFHQTVRLGGEKVSAQRNFLSLGEEKPEKRIEVYFGKLGVADFFDTNSTGSDSHLQFMNWTVDNNGAYDYSADTRGYTFGALVEYQGPWLEIRFGEMLMPKFANGLELDWDIGKNRAENLELELKYSSKEKWAGTLRTLGFLNHA